MTRFALLSVSSFLIGFAGISISGATAKDYGTLGATWPVSEPDLLASILGKLKQAEASGELDKMNKVFAKKAAARVNRPLAVTGVGRTTERRDWIFDPSITVEKEITDTKGNLIASAGQKVNPLDFVAMRQRLIFVDGDRSGDVAWALEQGTEKSVKIIFVNGSPLEQMKKTNRRIYYDQTGALVRKFGIKNVPAIVNQDGPKLKVSEIVGRAG